MALGHFYCSIFIFNQKKLYLYNQKIIKLVKHGIKKEF